MLKSAEFRFFIVENLYIYCVCEKSQKKFGPEKNTKFHKFRNHREN
jgi:hypothetical protein